MFKIKKFTDSVALMGKVPSLMLVLLALGCSHTAENKVVQKLEREPTLQNSDELSAEVHQMIESEKNFTDAQKAKLFELEKTTHSKLKTLSEDQLKLRSLLAQEVAAGRGHEKEVGIIKKRVTKNSHEQNKVLFDSVDTANAIIKNEQDPTKRHQMLGGFLHIRGTKY